MVWAALSLVTLFAIACSSSAPTGNDPPGFVCDYHPSGDGTMSFPEPLPQELGAFDVFVRVLVTGHRQTSPGSELVNIVTIEESVFGEVSKDETLELANELGVCLETGDSYYLLLTGSDATGFSFVNTPRATFPVINNRITLHLDMRRDGLIGDFHGLDPVLFKRRFTEFVERTDIEVD